MIQSSKMIALLWWSFALSCAAQIAPTDPPPLGAEANEVPLWCGKVYRPNDPYSPPGGMIDPPVLSKSPLLNLKIQQRYSPYLQEDTSGAFVIDTSLSYINGQPWSGNIASNSNNNDLFIEISRADTGRQIAGARVPVNVADTVVPFQWAWSRSGKTYTARFQLQRLPTRTDGGNVVKIDNLHGSLVVKTKTDNDWKPFLPYSFYLDSNWIAKGPVSQLAQWAKYGYNVIHVIPPYDYEAFKIWAQEAEKLGLWIMYDMRHTFVDPAEVTKQVNLFSKFSNMLLWYTADEPDGFQAPLDSTTQSYNTIKKIDPYHPVSLVLNCENYHFNEYTAGADIILTDPYPIGVNNTWSEQYLTVVNTTYGDSGCDNCYGYNDLTNLYARLNKYRTYQTQLDVPWQKPIWGVPQAFGNQAGWKRNPSADELAAMTMLYLNHGAKGIINWVFQTTRELEDAASRLAKMLLVPTAVELILGGTLVQVAGGNGDDGEVDAAAWMSEDGGTLLVSIVNPGRDRLNVRPISLKAVLDGGSATSIDSVLWGNGDWTLSTANSLTRGSVLPPLSVDLFTVKVKGGPKGPGSVALVGSNPFNISNPIA